MAIIGRVSRPLGDNNRRLACFPATMDIRLCVFLAASISFLLVNAATSFFSSSMVNNKSLGTPISTMRSMSSSFIPLYVASISPLSPTTRSRLAFASFFFGVRGSFRGDLVAVFTAFDFLLARSFFVGTRTKSMTYPPSSSSSSTLYRSSSTTRTLAPSGIKNQSSSSSSSSSSQSSSSSSIAIGSSSSKSSSFQNNKSSSASAARSYPLPARARTPRRASSVATTSSRRRRDSGRRRAVATAREVEGALDTRARAALVPYIRDIVRSRAVNRARVVVWRARGAGTRRYNERRSRRDARVNWTRSRTSPRFRFRRRRIEAVSFRPV